VIKYQKITKNQKTKSLKMVKRTGPSNLQMLNLIQLLRKTSVEQKVNIWKRIADDLSKPARGRREVNLFRIDKYSKDNESVIIPGKVLGTGDLNHKVTVAAFTFSESAKKKIEKANGTCVSIYDLLEKNPKGKGLRILG